VVSLDVAGAKAVTPAAAPSVTAMQEQLRLAEQRLKELEDQQRGTAK
jgi:hypothetical protein